MVAVIARRFGWLLATLVGLSGITFFLMHMIPGGPFVALEAGGVSVLSPDTIAQLKQQYGLDKPVWQQYLLYMWNLIHGDLGRSVVHNEDVGRMLVLALPASAQLGLLALSISVLSGVLLGVLAAVRQNTLSDHIVTFASIVGAAVPSFVLALILIVLFSLRWKLLPVAGYGMWTHLILPVVALSAEPIAVYARYSRSAMLDILGELYITVARSKGLSERAIVFQHALRNALPPVVTVIGLVIPRLFVGSFLVETIFAIPGTGRFLVVAVSQRDYPVVMAMAILYAAAVAFVNLLVDLSYAYLNPRLRYD